MAVRKVKTKAKASAERLWVTDYGFTKGRCISMENALVRAFDHLVRDCLSHCTIEDPDGKALCRYRYSKGHFSITIPEAQRYRFPEPKPPLRRVK